MLNKKIHLASKSPRRKFLLEEGGFEVVLIDIDVDETYEDTLELGAVPEFLAIKKAAGAIHLVSPESILMASDTVVILDNEILGKPDDSTQAADYLKRMSNRHHEVITGVCIIHKGIETSFSTKSTVFFDEIDQEEIEYYVSIYKPFDKAGAYGIQDWIGWCKIKRIEGSYSNIMGLPMRDVYQAISNL